MMDFDAFLYSLFGALLVYAASGAESTQRVLDGPPEGLAAAADTFNLTPPSPYIFSSLRSLLQQWPNTFFPNGHNCPL
jgi:hypothetical protein